MSRHSDDDLITQLALDDLVDLIRFICTSRMTSSVELFDYLVDARDLDRKYATMLGAFHSYPQLVDAILEAFARYGFKPEVGYLAGWGYR